MSTTELRKAIDRDAGGRGDIIIRAFLMRRRMLVEAGFVGVTMIGSRFSPAAHRLRDFAVRNLVPIRWMDLDSDVQAEEMLRTLGVAASETPIVIGTKGQVHKNPTLEQFARCAGLVVTLDADHVYDLVVVGAGPAGLAASVYAASEGLDVLTADTVAAGGQAGTSARIENYLGFPTGISGRELTQNALIQAQRFGAHITVPCTIRVARHRWRRPGGGRWKTIPGSAPAACWWRAGCSTAGWTCLASTNSTARGSTTPPPRWKRRCAAGEGGDRGGRGQLGGTGGGATWPASRDGCTWWCGAAISAPACRATWWIASSRWTMSPSASRRNVTGLEGDGHLGVGCASRAGTAGKRRSRRARSSSSSARDPNTSWLRGCVELDKKGFVLTGIQLASDTARLDPVDRARSRALPAGDDTLPGSVRGG
jgi:hypothetical protein